MTDRELTVEEARRAMQMLADEQAAHAATARAIADRMREETKAEQYRVERDKALAALRTARRAAIAECKAKVDGLVSDWGKKDDYNLNLYDVLAALDEVQP